MAAGFARKIFGANHQISSAGAEADEGAPAAKNAISAMETFGIDISNHAVVDVQSVNLAAFDVVVIFRPSAAENLSIPPAIRTSYINLEDPYGGSLQKYIAAAEVIQTNVRRIYAEDALHRAPSIFGSHRSGIFGRVAKELEKEAFSLATKDLGLKVRAKATLGEIAATLSGYARATSDRALAAFAAAADEANERWKAVKHKDDPPDEELLPPLASVVQAFNVLERSNV